MDTNEHPSEAGGRRQEDAHLSSAPLPEAQDLFLEPQGSSVF